MRTPKQIEASRANGAKSRGPKTAEGAAKCGGNRLRHGIYARAVVLDGESRKRFSALLDSLYLEYQPQTPSQEILVEKMAVAQWRQMRLWAYESSAIAREAKKQTELSGSTHPRTVDSLAFESFSPAGISQHELRYERQFNRCYDRLQKLKSKVESQQVSETKGDSEK